MARNSKKEKDPDEVLVYCLHCGLRQRTTYHQQYIVTGCKNCGYVFAVSEQAVSSAGSLKNLVLSEYLT